MTEAFISEQGCRITEEFLYLTHYFNYFVKVVKPTRDRRRVLYAWRLGAILLLFAPSLMGADLIPSERTNSWGTHIYRTPSVVELRARSVHVTYDSASAPSLSTLNSAIAACASNSIVLLTTSDGNPFTFAGRITVGKSGVYLVGETNQRVVINNTGSSAADMVYLSAGQGSSGDIFTGQTAYDVWTNTISRTQKGSSSIATKTTPTGIAVDDFITIDQLEGDAEGLVESDGNSGSCNWCGRSTGDRTFAQTLHVTNIVDVTNILFEPPLFMDFNIAQTIQVIEQPSVVRYAGVANIIFTNVAGVTDTLSRHGGYRCGVVDCKFYLSDRRHVWAFGGMQNAILGSDFRFGIGADWGSGYTSDSSYGILLGQNGSFDLIENNVFEKLSFPIAPEGANMGTVIAYNFATNIQNDSVISAKPFMGNHGSHGGMILVEGNWSAARISMDHYWGSSSHWTFLHNRSFIVTNQNGTLLTQYHVVFDVWTNNVFHTVIGNIFGLSDVENKYEIPSGGSVNEGSTDKNIRRVGNLNANHTTWSEYDPTVTNTLVWSVNWLSRTNNSTSGTGIYYDSGISDTNIPVSLYLSSKPSSQGFLPWPSNDPFNPTIATATNLAAGHRFYFGTNPANLMVAGGVASKIGSGRSAGRGFRQ